MTACGNRFLERLAGILAADPELPFVYLRQNDAYLTVTRSELAGRMGAHAAAWRAAGVGEGDVVFIILRHGADAMPAFLAAMWIGAVPSFLPFPNPRQDLALYREVHATVLRRTGAKALMAEPDLAAEFLNLLGPQATAVLAPPAVGCTALLPPPAAIAEEGAALLQHSSGTTGLKKGVVLSYRAVLAQLDAYAPTLGLDPRSCVASWLPLYHDMGLIACFLLPSVSGVPIVALDPFEWALKPQLLLEAIGRFRATHVWMPNFAFAHLTRGVPRNERYDLSSVAMLIGSSETNRGHTQDRFLARFGSHGLRAGTLQTSYGMAETVFAVSQSQRGVEPRRIGIRIENACVFPGDTELLSNGKPLAGVEIKVLHGGRMRSEERIVGELCVASPFNFSGYLGSGGTPDRFHRTGDIGFLDEGEVFVLGRIKDLIIVNGRNIYAHDVEAAVNDVPGIHPGRCIALGVASDRTGSEEIVVIGETSAPSPDLVAAVNRAVLAHFGMPCAAVELVPPGWLVKTTSGKVSRERNHQKYLIRAAHADATP
ncbi:AMP-binding protein [Roseococcus pinisoli]|uniref:AMP-binding protein n=1 Tax=Roseococcus pinisoli TaxID=2835040 RepID=A0ABS5Q9T2_9PROT|nr:AMP-binding protein [Roseococcus pinisoli]MBS7810279.1 AMP-binding protein [Roseococcus pinisoli]